MWDETLRRLSKRYGPKLSITIELGSVTSILVFELLLQLIFETACTHTGPDRGRRSVRVAARPPKSAIEVTPSGRRRAPDSASLGERTARPRGLSSLAFSRTTAAGSSGSWARPPSPCRSVERLAGDGRADEKRAPEGVGFGPVAANGGSSIRHQH